MRQKPAHYLLGIEEIAHSPIKYAKIFNRVEQRFGKIEIRRKLWLLFWNFITRPLYRQSTGNKTRLFNYLIFCTNNFFLFHTTLLDFDNTQEIIKINISKSPNFPGRRRCSVFNKTVARQGRERCGVLNAVKMKTLLTSLTQSLLSNV